MYLLLLFGKKFFRDINQLKTKEIMNTMIKKKHFYKKMLICKSFM